MRQIYLEVLVLVCVFTAWKLSKWQNICHTVNTLYPKCLLVLSRCLFMYFFLHCENGAPASPVELRNLNVSMFYLQNGNISRIKKKTEKQNWFFKLYSCEFDFLSNCFFLGFLEWFWHNSCAERHPSVKIVVFKVSSFIGFKLYR